MVGFVMNADGTNPIRLTDPSNGVNDRNPVWSPDGTKIAYHSHPQGTWDVMVMDADGSNQVNLTNSDTNAIDPTWSPDGTKIAFSASSETLPQTIFLMNADGSNPSQLTTLSLSAWPAWSPFLLLETAIETMPWARIKAGP